MKKHSFRDYLKTGELGVAIVKNILSTKYDDIIDYDSDMEMQRRGIDIFVEGLGLIEIKSDSHKTENFYFEVESNGKPGAIDRSQADWYCVLFYKYNVMYFIPMPWLHKWLRDNYHKADYKKHTTVSYVDDDEWKASGVIVPISHILTDIPDTRVEEYDLENRDYEVSL